MLDAYREPMWVVERRPIVDCISIEDHDVRVFVGNRQLQNVGKEIAVLRQVADPGNGEGARWARMRTHRILTDMLADLGASSKLNAEWAFVSMLKEQGRKSADEFLAAHGNDVGVRSTADLDVLLAEC